jgi:hypothetical protein
MYIRLRCIRLEYFSLLKKKYFTLKNTQASRCFKYSAGVVTHDQTYIRLDSGDDPTRYSDITVKIFAHQLADCA